MEDEEEPAPEDIKSPDHVHLLPPIEKARRRVRLKASESNVDPNFDPVLDEGSVYTTPSLFSLISIPDENVKNKVVRAYCLVVSH